MYRRATMGLGTRFGGTALPEVAAGPVLWEINVRPAGCCCWHPVVCVWREYDEIPSDDCALYLWASDTEDRAAARLRRVGLAPLVAVVEAVLVVAAVIVIRAPLLVVVCGTHHSTKHVSRRYKLRSGGDGSGDGDDVAVPS